MLRKLFIISRPFSSSQPWSSSSHTKLLEVGYVLKRSRRFTQEDLICFSKLTQDLNPIHLSPQSAQDAGFQAQPLVHGLLVAAIFPRIIASNFPGAIYVSQALQFKLPVYVEEEIMAEVEPTNLRENKNKYLAKFSTRCFKNGELVISGEAIALLPTLALCEEKST